MSEEGWLQSIGLEPGVILAYRATRRDGKILPVSTQNTRLSPASSRYRNGVTLRKIAHGWFLRIWTVDNSHHCKSCEMELNNDGSLVVGHVNCFALGWMPANQLYLDELLAELADMEWDEIKHA